MRLCHFFLVLLFVAMVYGDDDDYDDVTEDSAVEEMSVSGNVTDYDYAEDFGAVLDGKQKSAGCTGKFLYGKNQTKIEYLTRNARRGGNPVIRPMGFKQVKNGRSISGVKLI